MKYTITAPNMRYSRTVCGVSFVDGKGETEDEWAAQWFSGREGFTVSAKARKKKEGIDDGTGEGKGEG